MASSGHRVDRGILAVELIQLERLSGRRGRPRDHVGDLAGDVQVASAVIADVEDQIVHPGAFQLGERSDEFALCGREMVVEQHVSNQIPGRRRERLDVLYRSFGDVRGHQRHGARLRRAQVLDRERVALSDGLRAQARVQGVDACLIVGIHQVDTIDGENLRAARQARRGERSRRARLGVGHHDLARRSCATGSRNSRRTRLARRIATAPPRSRWGR